MGKSVYEQMYACEADGKEGGAVTRDILRAVWKGLTTFDRSDLVICGVVTIVVTLYYIAYELLL